MSDQGEALQRALEIFEQIGIIASGCATSHGDPGGGLEMINGYASDGFMLLASPPLADVYPAPNWDIQGYKSPAEEINDMAEVGRSLMDKLAIVLSEGQPMAGWSPADCPTEIVVDMANTISELRESLRDHIINAYVEGAYQVHTHWQEDADPDFGEAASDYAASVLP